MPAPSDQQLREYAARLPAIYSDILATFPGVAPDRREWDALTGHTIVDYVVDSRASHRNNDVIDGLRQLVDRGFLEKEGSFAYAPTPLGERLITLLTGHTPAAGRIPDLPEPIWE